MKEEFHSSLVSVLIDVVNSSGIEDGSSTDNSMHLRKLKIHDAVSISCIQSVKNMWIE